MSGPINPTPDPEATVVQVDVERVSGVIPLADLAGRMTQHLSGPVGLAATDPSGPADPALQARLQRVSELIRQLGEEMAQLPEGL